MIFQPLELRPCYKEYIWGGKRLKTDFNKSDAPDIVAESWELAAHSDGMSVVAAGEYAKKNLIDLGTINKRDFWGLDCDSEKFPLIVKLIDAAKDLSIQVHPSERTALASKGEQGKAEMWYIVDAAPRAAIYYGFSRKISREEFILRAKDGSICEVLNRVPVAKGDVFFILPGTIHAIGAGTVIAEIQQNSNTTFRIYDYLRRDSTGNLRPLHLERAAEVVNFTPIAPGECRVNNRVRFPGFTLSEMFSCQHFRAFCLDIHPRMELLCDGKSFHHLLCVEGEGKITYASGECLLTRGNSYFLPARLGKYTIEGMCRVLLSRI